MHKDWPIFPSNEDFLIISLILLISLESKDFTKPLVFKSSNMPNIAEPLVLIDVILLIKSYCIIFIASL